MTGARVFVAVLFLILGASFIASTGFLVREFQDLDWGGMVVAHSHLFFFFPVFGILALAAFYLPAVIFTDLYWRHRAVRQAALRARRHRGRRALADPGQAARYRAARPLGDIAQRARRRPRRAARLRRVRAAPAGGRRSFRHWRTCAGRGKAASASPSSRAAAWSTGCSRPRRRWTRSATASPPAPSSRAPPVARRKGCFATRSPGCSPIRPTRSLSATYDRFFLPLKVFFILIVVVIAALLAKWRDRHRPVLSGSWFRPSSAASSSAPSPCCSGPSWTTATSRPPTCCSGAFTARSCATAWSSCPGRCCCCSTSCAGSASRAR